MVLIGGVSLLTVRSVRSLEESRESVDHSYAVIQTLDRLLIALDETETGQRGYVITGDTTFLAPHYEGLTNARSALANLRSLVADDSVQQASLEVLAAEAMEKTDQSVEIVAVRRQSGAAAATDMVRTGRGKRVMDAVRSRVATMKNRENMLLQQRRTIAERSLNEGRIVSTIGVLLAAALAVVAILLVRRTLAALAQGRQAESYARTLLDSTSDGMYGIDSGGVIKFANRAMAQALGYQVAELVGNRAHALFHHTKPDGSVYPSEECPMYLAARGEFEGKVDNEIIWRRDGTPIPVEYSISPSRDPQGDAGAVISFRDITDRQVAVNVLRTAKTAAEAANTAKSDFLARMSHELRTPLNSVIGFSNVLLRNKSGGLGEQELGYLTRIQKNGVSLLSLINDILDLSKIEAGRMEVEISSTDLRELVEDVVAQFETQVSGKPVVLETVVPESIPPVDTDPGKLRQVLSNLIGNAIKFTEAGAITVAVVTDTITGAASRIEVTDSGIGIPADRMDAIFDAFEQAEKTTTRRFGGTGLGLPISRSLCLLLGYDLRALSREGRGSTFIIDLDPTLSPPHSTAFIPSADSEVVGTDAILRGKTVLVVDDAADDRLLLAGQIVALGGKYVEARSGPEALKLAREIKPDLITLDLLMPRVDGSEVLRLLKSDPDLKGIPVVVVSAVANERMGLVGALTMLPKPLSEEDLRRAFKEGVGLGRVLIVEDDPDTQRLLADYAFRGGASEVRVVGDGDAAITALDDFVPDLILLDLILPKRDGINALSRLVAHPSSDRFAVVVVTGKELTAGEIKAIQPFTIAILRKGENLEKDLSSVLRELVSRRGVARTGAGS